MKKEGVNNKFLNFLQVKDNEPNNKQKPSYFAF